MMRISWTGFGLVTFVIILGSCCVGVSFGRQHTGDFQVTFLAGGVTLLVGAAVNYVVGFALNTRKTSDGFREHVDGHTVNGYPIEVYSLPAVVLALLMFSIGLAKWVPWVVSGLAMIAVGLTAAFLGYRMAGRGRRRMHADRQRLATERGWRYTALDARLPRRWGAVLGWANTVHDGVVTISRPEEAVERQIQSVPPELREAVARSGDVKRKVEALHAPRAAEGVVSGDLNGWPVRAFDIDINGRNCTVWAVSLPAAYPATEVRCDRGAVTYHSDDHAFAQALVTEEVAEATQRGGLNGWRLQGSELLLVRGNDKHRNYVPKELLLTAESLITLAAQLPTRFGNVAVPLEPPTPTS